MDKWLSKKSSKKPEKNYSQEEILEGKKKKITELIGEKPKNTKKSNDIKEVTEEDDFFSYFMEFKNWLDQRTYLKGDIDKLETWVKNLYLKIETEEDQEISALNPSEKKTLIEDFKRIPPKLLDEKSRVALSKKLHGRQKTSSDTYYLRKLKTIVQEKLKEARYYEILKNILDSK